MAEEDQPIAGAEFALKRYVTWTEADVQKFCEAFSFDNFRLVEAKDGQEYIRVQLPTSIEPMARGLRDAEWRVVEAFEAPLEKESHKTFDQVIGDYTQAVQLPEEEEQSLIQKFGEFTDIVKIMQGQPDPALEELKRGVRETAHQMLLTAFKSLIAVALAFSWDDFLQRELLTKYTNLDDVPDDVKEAVTVRYKEYEAMRSLVALDPEHSAKKPRFVVIDSKGREFFKSDADLMDSGEAG